MTSALESKVIFLDKIGKVSLFLQGVIDLGTVISDVRGSILLFSKDLVLTIPMCQSHPVAKAAFSIVGLVFQV